MNIRKMPEDFAKFGKHFQEAMVQLMLEDRPYCDQITEVLDTSFFELAYLQVFVDKILVLGIAYKKNIDDLRESPSLEILKELFDLGAEVKYSDPYFDTIPTTRKYSFSLSSTSINKNCLNKMDLVLLATDHDDFDYNLIEKEAKLIVDTRGRFNSSNKIIKS